MRVTLPGSGSALPTPSGVHLTVHFLLPQSLGLVASLHLVLLDSASTRRPGGSARIQVQPGRPWGTVSQLRAAAGAHTESSPGLTRLHGVSLGAQLPPPSDWPAGLQG